MKLSHSLPLLIDALGVTWGVTKVFVKGDGVAAKNKLQIMYLVEIISSNCSYCEIQMGRIYVLRNI